MCEDEQPTPYGHFFHKTWTRLVWQRIEKPKIFKLLVIEVGHWFRAGYKSYQPSTKTQKMQIQRQHVEAKILAEKATTHEKAVEKWLQVEI